MAVDVFVAFHGTLIALLGLMCFLVRNCGFCLCHCSHGIEKVEGELAKIERIQLFDSIQGLRESSIQGRSEFESMLLLEHVFSCRWCVSIELEIKKGLSPAMMVNRCKNT